MLPNLQYVIAAACPSPRPRTLEDVQAAVAQHDHVMPNAEGHSWNQVGTFMQYMPDR
jgi:hypothetical protein